MIYVAGKYRGKTTYEQIDNIRHAELAAIKLWRENWVVICPHLNTQFFDQVYTDIPVSVWLDGGLEILKRCNAVFLLSNWEDSEGAKQEYKLACDLGLELFYEDNIS